MTCSSAVARAHVGRLASRASVADRRVASRAAPRRSAACSPCVASAVPKVIHACPLVHLHSDSPLLLSAPIDRVHIPPALTYPTYPTHRHLTRDRRFSSSAAPAASASSSSPNSSRLATSSARRRAIPNPRVRSSAPTTISSCAPRTYATPPRSPRRGYATASTPWCRARAPQRSRAPGGRMATDRKTPISSEHQTS